MQGTKITFSDGPLVSVDWLSAHLGTPGLRIIDTRKGEGLTAAHILGALKLGISALLHESGEVVAPDILAGKMARLGGGPETDVIAYDDANNLFGARLWWVLSYFGRERVRVLDGGWDGWVAAGLEVNTEPTQSPETAPFTPRPEAKLLAETGDVHAAMADPAHQILDVRSDCEWYRAEPTETSLAGHIPGAVHIVWSDLIDPVTRRFLPPQRLRLVFEGLGLRREVEIIVYCQGGIRAAHTVLALNLAGFEKVRNYEGSWAAWSRANMPAQIAPRTQTANRN